MSDGEARRWVFGGRVQGVGFRPFVYRAAHRHRVEGWVRNLAGTVEVIAQGRPDNLLRFGDSLLADAPPLARPEKLADAPVPMQAMQGFAILDSRSGDLAHVEVPPDYFACDACLAELRDPADRRYRYPFINCTQCGPRYTLMRALPYDRPSTTMAGFAMCARCAAEYADPLDRRFHAEPIACPECGPRLEFRSGTSALRGEDALAACVAALASGQVVAVKGIGGYHLMCDAADPGTVARLRSRKARPHKPLAVMFPLDAGLSALSRAVRPDRTHRAALLDPMRPIVLVPRREDSPLAPDIAPGCNEIGAMLPYSPLHHLLLADFGAPLVATSANISGEPVLTENAEAETRLARVADAFLHHDRPIARPADDPVCRVVLGKPRPLRLGRGSAPLEIDLPFALPRPLLALGGHLKNTVALGWGRRAVVSPHLGDMDAPRSIDLLQQVAADLQALYGVSAGRVICDAHPGYATTRLAARRGLPVSKVFHHRAHASALAGEFDLPGEWLVFTWDGIGYGEDGTLWGGEALLGRAGAWRRVASLRPFALPGGERVAREPWRSALALCWETGRRWDDCPHEAGLLRQAWERGLNCPRTSSAGRLFDAAAALLGLVAEASFEAQAAMALESACTGDGEAVALPLARRDGLWVSDWAPLLDVLCDERRSIGARAAAFHAALASVVLDQARAVRSAHGVSRVGLTGGVFQNRVLCERVARLAAENGFDVFVPERVPCNDAGLSFGQLVEAGAGS
ncbi:MAG TPA: carbamoyltransferase HypF [Burkholderiales bacterium]|nr:carbamoyltransferase HypF [Burkholderiales bacterium]